MKDYAIAPPFKPEDCESVRRVKLPNRRVDLARKKDGGVVLRFRILRGWKRVIDLWVPLSREGASATLDLLLESDSRTRVEWFKHEVKIP